MGFSFVGLNEALDDIAEDKEKAIALKELQEEKERQRERQDKSDDLQERSFGLRVSQEARVAKAAETAEELAREKLLRDNNLKFLELVGPQVKKNNQGSQKNINKNASALLMSAGFPKEYLAQIATVEPAAITRIWNSVNTHMEKNIAESKVAITPEFIQKVINKTVTSEPEARYTKADLDKIKLIFGGELTSGQLEQLEDTQNLQSVNVNPLTFARVKATPIEDLSVAEKRIIDPNTRRRDNDVELITKVIADEVNKEDTSDPILNAWLTKRLVDLKETGKDPYKIAKIYGTNSSILFEKYPSLKNAGLDPLIANVKADPIEVANYSLYEKLKNYGFFKENDVVYIDDVTGMPKELGNEQYFTITK